MRSPDTPWLVTSEPVKSLCRARVQRIKHLYEGVRSDAGEI